VSFLLDTNIVSEVRKPHGDPDVKAWIAAIDDDGLYLSVLVLGEIRRGIELLRRRDPDQAAVLDAWLSELRREFADRVVPVTLDVAEEWGRLNAQDPLPLIDSLMAATAKVHGWTFVSRNTAGLEAIGVRLLNPFRR